MKFKRPVRLKNKRKMTEKNRYKRYKCTCERCQEDRTYSALRALGEANQQVKDFEQSG